MILDIRYHIASLVAVFLALGLGILIGASLLDEGRLVESQEKLIVGLEKRFDTLQAERSLLETENAQLHGKLQEQESLFAALELPLVEEALIGRSVTIVYGSETWQDSWQTTLEKLLAQAGARIASSRLMAGLLQGSATLSAAGEDVGEMPSGQDPEGLTVNLLALTDDAVGLLGDKSAIATAGTVDMLVLVGTGGDSTAVWERLLVDEAIAAGITVAVVGTREIETHLHELAQGEVLALDNLDSVAGRVGLIRGLMARESGYYGAGKSAQGPWLPFGQTRTRARQ
ncbi:MAG: copper transporter [Firmicutes bacterium]|nr:copper transporter [Bacillota bacterium]